MKVGIGKRFLGILGNWGWEYIKKQKKFYGKNLASTLLRKIKGIRKIILKMKKENWEIIKIYQNQKFLRKGRFNQIKIEKFDKKRKT